MTFATTVSGKFGFRLRRRVRSPDNDPSHIASEVIAWKSSVYK